jgi:hypothetical protein
LLKALSDRPNVAQLERFLEHLLAERHDDLEFVTPFGSGWRIRDDDSVKPV